jgi:uncharacterized RmlC-like cupin family protein
VLLKHRRLARQTLYFGRRQAMIRSLDMKNENATRLADSGKTDDYESGVVTVRPTEQIVTRQGLPNFVGISARTAGARGLCMNMVIIPPGGAAEPHYHDGFETAIYLIAGRVETLYGPGLRQSVINEAGDFLFIAPGVPHQPRNLSETEPACAVVSRNDAKEQESVVLYDPANG